MSSNTNALNVQNTIINGIIGKVTDVNSYGTTVQNFAKENQFKFTAEKAAEFVKNHPLDFSTLSEKQAGIALERAQNATKVVTAYGKQNKFEIERLNASIKTNNLIVEDSDDVQTHKMCSTVNKEYKDKITKLSSENGDITRFRYKAHAVIASLQTALEAKEEDARPPKSFCERHCVIL